MEAPEPVPAYQDPANEPLLRGVELLLSREPTSTAALWTLLEVEEARAAERKNRGGMTTRANFGVGGY
jgi:hypothetical protein